MIYLKSEKAQFAKTLVAFEAAYSTLLQGMYDTFKEKSATRDADTPIHHRMSPATMVSLAQAKMRRIETMISKPGWVGDEALCDKVIEECKDVANYNAYVAALCVMMLKENSQ